MTSSSKSLQDEALEQLMRATSGHATKGDLLELEKWRARSDAHAEAYRSALQIWNALGTAAHEAATPEDRALIAGRRLPRAATRRAFLAGATAIAAAGAGVAVIRPPLDLWPSLGEMNADYRTDTGEHRSITLAEGASVEMNTRTSIVRRPAEGTAERIELIAGEAAISTAPGPSRSLTVIAGEGSVDAAVAKFNLRRDAGSVLVTCLDGSVRVQCAGNSRTLTAHEQVAYSNERIGPVKIVDPEVVTSWRQGLLIFRDEPLSRIVDEINRYRPGHIVLLNEDLGRRRITMRVELARIDEVIVYARTVLDARIRSLPGGVVLVT